ncbi:Lysine-specific histone demethylase 1B [Taenia solium]|eukprot:TsM_000178500 transcript=TsM_000178500 gene=TsM_000178500
MNISGIEFSTVSPQVKCGNAYCAEMSPICFAGIDRNTTSSCLTVEQDTWYRRFREWVDSFKDWSLPYGEAKISVYDFITNNVLPLWRKCIKCGRWRHVTTGFGSNLAISRRKFKCQTASSLRGCPCSQPEDQRVSLVVNNRVNFQASMQMPGLVHNSRLIFLCPQYSPVLLGIEPPALGTQIDFAKSCDWSLNYPEFRKPFCGPNEFPIPAGAWSPIEIFKWENSLFPFMTRYPSLYRAIRNTVIYLWNHNRFRMVTARSASRFLLIRGLIRIIIVDEWLPFLLEHLTYRGLINFGACIKWTVPKCSEPRRSVVVGSMDLKSAILLCQLKNGFELHRKHSEKLPDVAEFSALKNVHIPSVFAESQFTLQLDGFEDTRITFLNHYLGNHVVDPINNDVMVLAHQLGLQSTAELPATIFNPRGERLVIVVEDTFNRVQRSTYKFFLHVMSKRTFETEFISLMTVQDMFDSLHCKMLSQLPEQRAFQNDSQLCEYFLACIEERLIERLLLYGGENTPSPISLCNMSPTLLHSLLSNPDPFYPQTLHLLSDNYKPFRFADFNAHKVFVDRLIPSTSEENRVCGVVFQHIGSRNGLYILRQNDTELQLVASVIVTLPSSALKIIFCDDPVGEALLSCHSRAEDDALLIYLPHHFRIPTGQTKLHPREMTERPLFMSVTLIYPSPWWRPLLSKAMEPDSLLMEGYGVDLDEFPENFKAPYSFAFIPEDRSLRGFCHNFRDLSHDCSDTVGIIQTQILSRSIEDHWTTDDEVLAQLVHAHLVKCLKASKTGYQRYIASSINRLSPLAMSNVTSDPPNFEARSANPELTKVDTAIYFRNARKPEVEATKFDFYITENWWRLLSDGAAIHVLSELTRSCESTKFPEDEVLARDALSWEVMTGLRWAKFCLTENSPQTCLEKRAIASLKAAAINAHDALHLGNSSVVMEVVDTSDDNNEDDDDEKTKIGTSNASKRSSSLALRRSSRLVKRPCTINL